MIATKLGYTFDANERVAQGEDSSPDYIRRACQASLRLPGIRTVEQAEENAGAIRIGPLSRAEMAEIAELLAG